MSLAPVISPDLLKRLKKLVVEAERDADQFATAHRRYLQAGQADIKASSALAIELYDFTLKYAAHPKSITAKLDELQLQYKKTTSVYYHICRLAFSDVPNADRSRMNRYARVIESAHQAKKSTEEFRAMVESGITKALMRLNSAPGPKADKLISQGKKIVRDGLNNKTYSVKNVKLDGVSDGQEVQLLARYEKGKFVIYGVVPPTFSTPTDMLKRIGTETEKEKSAGHDVLPLLLKTIKLITNESDNKARATWTLSGSKATFVVATEGATAALSVKAPKLLFDASLTYSVANWAKIIKTLMPIRRKLAAVECSQKGIVVSVDEVEIENLGSWFEEHHRAIAIGQPEGATLRINTQSLEIPVKIASGRAMPLGSFGNDRLKHVLGFKGPGKLLSVDLGSAEPKVVTVKNVLPKAVHFDKSTFRLFKKSLSKLLGLKKVVTLEKRTDRLCITTKLHEDIAISVEHGLAG